MNTSPDCWTAWVFVPFVVAISTVLGTVNKQADAADPPPPLVNEIAALKAVRSARVGHYKFDEARPFLEILYETQLKPRPDLIASELPIGFRETADQFIRYAEFSYASDLQSEIGLADGESSNEFYFFDEHGVWKGEFEESYTQGTDFIRSSMFVHPVTRRLVRVNLASGRFSPKLPAMGRFGRFEDRNYPLTEVKLVVGKEAKPYIEAPITLLILRRMNEIESGIASERHHKGHFVNALGVCAELQSRGEVMTVVGNVFRKLRRMRAQEILDKRAEAQRHLSH